jgi:hypothetical protein
MRIKYFYIIITFFTLISCEEKERVIVPFVPSGNRVILLEEITGKGLYELP